MSRNGWRFAFNTVPKYYPSAGRPFFPRGPRLSLDSFQRKLKELKGPILDSIARLDKSPLRGKLFLGNKPLSEVRDLATYLYDNTIHPLLFSETLSFLADKAEELASSTETIRLRKLQRYGLADAIKKGALRIEDIGQDFTGFESASDARKLAILKGLGVMMERPIAETPLPQSSAPVIPRFKLGEKLVGLIQLTKLPPDFYDFERFSIDSAGLSGTALKRAVEAFFEPDNFELAGSMARSFRKMGGFELSVKFHQTNEGIAVEFKSKGTSHFIDSASITLIPRPRQGKLCI